ncbi:hypothetical protein RHGRI_036264 [Rhododendron griersonianum]|uniref:Thioesterase domain-containing protein n=1 Tax=Rhododendron griersonianum TaxID=479676 RepID=A0AAV6HQ95_9ERIC|nr:hypothetical protein RHGRI_036264 [Rhododendron griersonianum]
MDKAKEFLTLNEEVVSETVSRLTVPPDRDRTGNFATGAISYLVDALGGAVAYVEGRPMNASVDVSISFLPMAKPDVSCHLLAPNPHFSSYVFSMAGKGGYSGTSIILIRNKVTGEVVAEGRHSFLQ